MAEGIMSLSLKSTRARILPDENSPCPVLDVGRPSSNVTKMNHAYAAVVGNDLRGIIANKQLYADGMCQA